MPKLASLFSQSNSINRKTLTRRLNSKSDGRPLSNPVATLMQVFIPNVEEMQRVFAKFDADSDGKISPRELARVLNALGMTDVDAKVAEMIKVADSNRDGLIDFKEFMEVHTKDGGIMAAEIRSAFHVFDLDGNGRIDADELFDVLRSLGEGCSRAQCRDMVMAVDSSRNGLVNMDDFMHMMTKTMKLA